jgi:thioredoxin 1
MKKIVRFTASWCGPCKMLAKTLEQIETDIPIEVVDIDEQPELATEFGIRGVPTLVMVEDNVAGKRLVGNKTIQEIEAFIHD